MLKEHFLYPRSAYHGKVTPESLVFNANLQEFAQKVNIICALETGGKLSPAESYHRIQALWEEFSQTTQALGIFPAGT